MKARILSFAFVLIALFSFNNAFAQNCHQIGNLSITVVNGDDIRLSGKIGGLGNIDESVQYTLNGSLTGTFECVPPGQRKQDPGAVAPGQTTYQVSGSGTGTPRNGALVFAITQDSPCKEQFDLRISNASFSGTIDLKFADGTTCSVTLQ